MKRKRDGDKTKAHELRTDILRNPSTMRLPSRASPRYDKGRQGDVLRAHVRYRGASLHSRFYSALTIRAYEPLREKDVGFYPFVAHREAKYLRIDSDYADSIFAGGGVEVRAEGAVADVGDEGFGGRRWNG